MLLAELALGEMEHVPLEDALAMVRPYGEAGDRKCFPAARKWLARWIIEQRPSLEDIAATAGGFVDHSRHHKT